MKAIAWFGTVANIVGAFAVALGFGLFGYSAFLIGAGTWAGIAHRNRDNALLTLNATFIVANIIGLIRFWS